jgi:uroporphyrinogen-III synthase
VAGADLQSRTILVTRPASQAASFCRLITEAGGEAVRFPAIEIRPVPISEHEAKQLKNWHQFDLALFVSTNAVHHALAYIKSTARAPVIGSVGAKTAELLTASGLRVDLVPEAGFNSEALLALPELQSLQGKKILILKGQGGRELLRETLIHRGGEVYELALYHRGLPEASPEVLNHRGQQGEIDLVAVTSLEILSNLQKLLGFDGQDWLKQVTLLAGSARIADQARAEGFRQIIVAADPSDESMFGSVLQWNKLNKAESHE